MRHRDLVESIPDCIATLNSKGTILSCNAAAAAIAGCEREELLGKHFSKSGVLRARDVPRYLKLFAALVAGQVLEPVEIETVGRDGTTRTPQTRAGLIRKGRKTVGLQVAARDVTERRAAERALSRAHSELSQVYNAAAPLSVVAKDDTLLRVNDTFCSLFDLKSEEVLGRPCYEIWQNPRCETSHCMPLASRIEETSSMLLPRETQTPAFTLVAAPPR